MGAVNGLGLDGRVPPRIVEHHVAGGGQVQARAGGAQAEEKNRRRLGRSERPAVTSWRSLVSPVRMWVRNLAGGAFLFQDAQHLHELAEEQHLLVLRQQRLEQFKQACRSCRRRRRCRPAADGSKSGAGGSGRPGHEWCCRSNAAFGHGVHHLLAAAAQFGQVELPLGLAQLAIAPLLDAVGQVARDFALEAAQQQRAQFGREAAAGDALFVAGVFAARLVFFAELLLACPGSRAGRNPRCSKGPAGGSPGACRSGPGAGRPAIV